jgi:hypothetical protein
MLNHDCAANCIVHASWGSDAAAGSSSGSGSGGSSPGAITARVSTLRPVAEGEELCISYVPRLAPRRERQQRLRAYYGFTCTCARCAAGDEAPASASSSSDAAVTGSAARYGVEDTIVYQCPRCSGGQIQHATVGACCSGCGYEPPPAALTEWAKQRQAFMARPRDLPACVLDDASTALHLTDTARSGMAYSQLGSA